LAETRQSRKGQGADTVAVLGLGRFGGQVAHSLLRLGHEVLGIDSDPRIVQQWSDRLTQVAQADTTDNAALLQLGVSDLQRVVVGIGSHLEASVLTVLALVEIGVAEIWARATSTKHGKILDAVGAAHVVYPEAAMGERVARLISSKLLDFVELDDGFAVAKTRPPEEFVGRSMTELEPRTRSGVVVVAVRGAGDHFEYALPQTVIPPDSVLIVAGTTEQVQRFAAET
jgi:trk system potassium uptake protein